MYFEFVMLCMEMKSAEIEIARDSFHSWDYHTGAGIEISILEISVRFTLRPSPCEHFGANLPGTQVGAHLCQMKLQ